MFDGRGPPTFKIQGELYHQIGPLEPQQPSDYLYSQLYILDPDKALSQQVDNNHSVSVATMTLLQDLLLDCNPFTCIYSQVKALTDSASILEYYLRLDFIWASDHCWYNRPSVANELAAIIPGDVELFINLRQIIVCKKGGPLMCITKVNPAYIPLHFPLLTPTGQLRWHPGLQYTFQSVHKNCSQKTLTFCDFLKHHLHI